VEGGEGIRRWREEEGGKYEVNAVAIHELVVADSVVSATVEVNAPSRVVVRDVLEVKIRGSISRE